MKKLYLLIFYTALLSSNVVTAQCSVDFTTSSDNCTGLPVTINFTYAGNSNGGGCLNFSWNFGDGSPTSNAQNPTHNYATAGAKNVSLTITNPGGFGCGGGCFGGGGTTATKVVNITPKPNVSFSSTAPQCVNVPVNFTNTANNAGQDSLQYSWDFGVDATPRTSVAQNPHGIIYTSSGTKSVTFQIVNSVGCANTVVQNITINATPVADFTSTAPQCTGLPVDFTNTGTSVGVTYSWNFGSGATSGTSTLQSPTGIIYSTAGSKIITSTITNSATSCAVTATQTININKTPIVSFTSTAPQCVNSPVTFTNTANNGGIDTTFTYNWDFGIDANPATSTTKNPLGITYSSSGTKSVTFKIATTEGCSNTVIQNITIQATPVVSFTSTAPQCTGLPVDFTNTGTSVGVTYSWNFGSGAAAPGTSTLPSPTGIIYSTAGSKIITSTITNSATSCAVTATQTININQTPTASFNSNAPQCVGKPVTYTNTGSSGGQWSYSWDFGDGASPKSSSSESPTGIDYTNGGTKTITLTTANGLCTQTSTQTITINALPIANAGKDTTICANTSVPIGSVAVDSNSYSWFPISTLTFVGGNNAQPVATPVALNTQYIVTVTDPTTSCVNTDTINVTMLAPLVADAGIDGVICRYDSIQIGAGLLKGQHYAWSPVAGLNNTALPNPIATPDKTTTYTVTVTGDYLTTGISCPAVTDNVTIIVHQLPIANAGPDDTITVGSSTQLVATGGLQYEWSPSYTLNNAGINTPIANPTETMQYIVQVTDIYGCVNQDTVIITVITPAFWLPNAFTPNGDGKSDIFRVRGEGIQKFEFGIFNRWGEQIFYSKDINIGWDGTRLISGDKLPEGAYVYYVKGVKTNGEIVDVKGMVNLIR